MKQLKTEEMSSINGGSFMDGVCGAFAMARLFAAPLAITGVGLGIVTAGTAVCIGAKMFGLY